MHDPIYIAGPTASGKSAVALRLAELLRGEIISVDSMQVYRGLDLGTAKPSAAERARVPHHLIDVAEPNASFDAARFVQLARSAETDIRAGGKVPIYCGGTGLYFNALAKGLGNAPAPDARLRAELEQLPSEALCAEIERNDPELYAKIDRANRRRLIRAVEVIRTSGASYSSHRANWAGAEQIGFWFGLERDRSDLAERINARVDAMFAAGLVAETRALVAAGLEKNPTAMQAIGYRQVVEHLRGERPLGETIELVKQKTRQYARRQLTWFRRQLRLQWIQAGRADSPEAVAEKIASALV